MKAVKTPSGKWTCLAYYQDSDGKEHRKRFTADRKKDAERSAEVFLLSRKDENISHSKNFREAAEEFIRNREAVISPATVRVYNYYLKSLPGQISEKDLEDITDADLQIIVNEWSKVKSPKTVRNQYGFITAVLKAYRIDLVKPKLPQKKKARLYTPSNAEVQRLFESVRDTRMEIPVLLAATCSMRRSEICALEISDVGDGVITVDKALVMGPDHKLVVKTTKTEAGTRIIIAPKQVTDRVHELVKHGRVTDMTPAAITCSFVHVLRCAGLPNFRFHDLRSYYASAMHYLGVPDKYIMQMGGWHDESTLQNNYKRVLGNDVKDVVSVGTDFFGSLLDH